MSKEYHKDLSKAELAASVAAYGWQSDKEGHLTLEMCPEAFKRGFLKGYEHAEKDLGWHSVDKSLPPVDEEVIALTDEFNTAPIYKIAFGHIVNPHLTVDIDGKPYKAVSYNGWNIPGVKYWMPMPILPEEDVK